MESIVNILNGEEDSVNPIINCIHLTSYLNELANCPIEPCIHILKVPHHFIRKWDPTISPEGKVCLRGGGTGIRGGGEGGCGEHLLDGGHRGRPGGCPDYPGNDWKQGWDIL